MTEKKAVTVNIYGNEYTLKGEADPQYMAELAKYVDAKMSEIGRKSSAPAAKVAILASMNIADELHRLEKAKSENLKLIETLEKNLLEMKRSSDGSLKHTLEQKEQMDRLRSENSDLSGKKQDLDTEIQKLTKDLANAKIQGEELEKLVSKNNELSQKNQDLETEVQKLKKDLSAAEALAEEAGSALEKTRQETQRSADNSEEVQKLRTELNDLKGQVNPLRENLTEEKKKAEAGQLEINSLKSEIQHLQDEVSKARTAAQEAAKEAAAKPTQIPVASGANPVFGFPEDKIKALVKKIDAIME